MINFWSYKREYKKIKSKILIKIDKTLSKGNIFFGNELNNFEKKFLKKFENKPNHLSLLSYDLVGLIYFLSLNNELTDLNKLFKKKSSFKGKIGIFDIKDNKIYHRLNFYQINEGKLKEIF